MPREANTIKHINIHAAPIIKHFGRTNFYTKYKPGNVVTTFTAPRMIWVRKGFERPTEVKTVVP